MPLDLAASGLELLVIDTGVTHRHADGGYGDRRRQCEAAATALGVPALRDADLTAVESLADEVLVLDVYSAGETPIAGVGSQRIVDRLTAGGHRARHDTHDSAAAYLEGGGSVEGTGRALFLHPNTVRPHLERMREVGLLVVETDNHGGVGRPQHLYSLAPDAPSLGLEPAPMPMLARMLLGVAAAAGAAGDEAVEAGREHGRAAARAYLDEVGRTAGEA
ncbi:MAG: helix-turn-helix domain-containing protein, partial [Proteobacteria bacterium]|nr:helix-turn-helix domain-containing protein [Pseudomonadota bacterium]